MALALLLAGFAGATGSGSPAATRASTRIEAFSPNFALRALLRGAVSGSQTFGTVTVGPGSDWMLADRKRVNRYPLQAPGTVTKLTIYLQPTSTSGSQTIKGVIYADNAGAPGTLLATSSPLAFQSTQPAGWYDLTFPTGAALSAGTYWIGMISGNDSGVAGFRSSFLLGSRWFNGDGYSTGPTNPFGPGTIDSELMSEYATYTPKTSAPPTIAPASVTAPVLSGTAQAGQTLTASTGTWQGSPTGYAYQWQRCAAGSCSPIGLATTGSYKAASADVGSTLKVTVTATNGGGSATATSASSLTIAAVSAPPVVLGAALPTPLPASTGASYYVDGTRGSDSSSASQAQSVATPWRSVQHALDVVGALASTGVAGPTIFIRSAGAVITDAGPGSTTPYTSQYLFARGLWPARSPLTITNYPGERVLLNSQFISGNYAANVRLHGTPVGSRLGVVVDQEFPLVHAGDDGVALIGVANYEVSGLEIRNSLSQGIYVGSDGTHHVSSSNVQILGNYIHNSGCYTCAPNLPTRATAPLGHDHGIYYGGTSGGQVPGARGGIIANNIITHSFDFNIALHNAPQGTVVVNNTLDGWGTAGPPPTSQQPITFSTSYYPASIEVSSSVKTEFPTNLVIKNNIGANGYYGIYYYMISGTGAIGNSENHNLFFHQSVALRKAPVTTGLTYGTDLLGVDPQWANPATQDYRLGSGSPARAAGDAAYTPPLDYFGHARTSADLGAVGG